MFSKGWNTGFGTVPVTINAQTTGTYEWYLTSDATIIVVGISELDERAQNQYGFPFGRKWKCYGMTELHAFQVTEVWGLTGKRCIEKKQNSIKLRLDCTTRCMDFTVNEAHFCRLTDVADGEYRLAVTLSGEGACAHIQTFDRCMSTLDELSVPERLEYVVFGYAREAVSQQEEEKLNVPSAIKLLLSTFLSNLWVDSIILSSEEKEHLLELVESHKNTKQFAKCEWKLLFRATRNGFSTKAFHEVCDGKENTVCFVETEFNHICGGYVHKAWTSAAGGRSEWAQKCPQAFMFVLRPTQEVFEQTKGNRSSVGHHSHDAWGFGYTVCTLVFRQINGFLHHNSSHFARGDKSVRRGQNPN